MHVVYLPPATLTPEQKEALIGELIEVQPEPTTIEELRTIITRPATNAGLIARMANDANAVLHFVGLEAIRETSYPADVLQDMLDRSTTCRALCHDIAEYGCQLSTATVLTILQEITEVYSELLAFADPTDSKDKAA